MSKYVALLSVAIFLLTGCARHQATPKRETKPTKIVLSDVGVSDVVSYGASDYVNRYGYYWGPYDICWSDQPNTPQPYCRLDESGEYEYGLLIPHSGILERRRYENYSWSKNALLERLYPHDPDEWLREQQKRGREIIVNPQPINLVEDGSFVQRLGESSKRVWSVSYHDASSPELVEALSRTFCSPHKIGNQVGGLILHIIGR